MTKNLPDDAPPFSRNGDCPLCDAGFPVTSHGHHDDPPLTGDALADTARYFAAIMPDMQPWQREIVERLDKLRNTESMTRDQLRDALIAPGKVKGIGLKDMGPYAGAAGDDRTFLIIDDPVMEEMPSRIGQIMALDIGRAAGLSAGLAMLPRLPPAMGKSTLAMRVTAEEVVKRMKTAAHPYDVDRGGRAEVRKQRAMTRRHTKKHMLKGLR